MRSRHALGAVVAALSLLAVATPAGAQSRIEKNLDLQPGGQLVVKSEVGSITVSGAARSGAHIVVTSERDDLNRELDFSFSSGGGIAQVTARRKERSWWGHSPSVHFEIEVPAETRTQIATGGGRITLSGLRAAADVKTSGGPIELTGLNGNVEAHTSGGPIRLREVTGNAHVSTSGGPIDVDALDGSLQAHTSGGRIRINRVSGYVEARTSGGPIRVTYSPGNRHGGVFETSGGPIELAIDPSAGFTVDASSSGGPVTTDPRLRVVGTVTRSSLRGSIGAGGEELRLHTSGGPIHIGAL